MIPVDHKMWPNGVKFEVYLKDFMLLNIPTSLKNGIYLHIEQVTEGKIRNIRSK